MKKIGKKSPGLRDPTHPKVQANQTAEKLDWEGTVPLTERDMQAELYFDQLFPIHCVRPDNTLEIEEQ